MNYLYTAYIATWVIHIAYLGHVLRNYTRVKDELEELKKN